MTEEELKNKCKERAKIFQQAMESCKSSSPMDCIEWLADRIVELEKSCDETQELLDKQIEATYKLVEENAELKKKCYKKAVKDYCEVESQLTKAKEHIENLLYYVKQCSCERSNYAEIEEDIKQAEQFLSCKEILNN